MKRKTYYYSPSKKEDFSSVKIRDTKPLANDYKFVTKNVFHKAFDFWFYYGLAAPILALVSIIRYHAKIENKKYIRKALKDTGFFIYSNHTMIADAWDLQTLLLFPRRGYIVSQTDTITRSKFLAFLVTALGAVPLPTNFHNARGFLHCLETRLQENAAVIIYPEATIWPYYTGQRPIRKGSFKYPRTFNKPVVFACTTFKEPRGLLKKYKAPRVLIHLSDPVYPTRNDVQKIDEKRLEELYNAFIEKWTSQDNYVTNRFVLKEDKTYPYSDGFLEEHYDEAEKTYLEENKKEPKKEKVR